MALHTQYRALCDFTEEDDILCEEDEETYEPVRVKAIDILEEAGWSFVEVTQYREDGTIAQVAEKAYCPAHTIERKVLKELAMKSG
jgi:hypothetical protein